MKDTNISLFEWKRIRKIYDEKTEKWYFSIIDIVWVLTDQDDYTKSRKYWNKLAERLRNESTGDKLSPVEDVGSRLKNETYRCSRCRNTFKEGEKYSFF